jgi:hypothetical protein
MWQLRRYGLASWRNIAISLIAPVHYAHNRLLMSVNAL